MIFGGRDLNNALISHIEGDQRNQKTPLPPIVSRRGRPGQVRETLVVVSLSEKIREGLPSLRV